MSNCVVVAIDWTGRSKDLDEQIKRSMLGCQPDCQSYVPIPARIRFSTTVSNCEVTTAADLSQPQLVLALKFETLPEAKDWFDRYKNYFDFVQLLASEAE